MSLEVPCTHWSDCGIQHGGCCGLGLYGGRPSTGVCSRCPTFNRRKDGIGDAIAAFTLRTGIAGVVEKIEKATGVDCGCKGRQKALNQLSSNEQPKQ